MAVTKEQTPTILALSHSDLIYVASSTNSAQDQFKYIFDFKVDVDGTRSQVARVRQAKNPNDYGVVNASMLISSYVKPTYYASQDDTEPIHFINSIRTGAASKNTDTLKVLEVEYGESYASGTVTPTDNTNLNNDERYILLGSSQVEGGLDWSFDDYVMNDASAKFLTDMPRTRTLHGDTSGANAFGDWMTLGFLNPNLTGAVGDATNLVVTDYNSNGTPNANNYSVFAASASEDQALQFVGVGPGNIFEAGDIAGETLDGGYYEVQLQDVSGNAASETFTFYVEDKECKHPRYQLAFLNRYGCWDYIAFNKKSTRRLDIERDTFRGVYGDYTTPSGTWAYKSHERGLTNYNTRGREIITMNTDWITEAEATWLEQLLTSPEVYILNMDVNGTAGSDSVRPIVIRESSYDIKTSVNDKVFNLQIEVELAHPRRLI